MTIVLLRITLHRKKRDEHLSRILSCCFFDLHEMSLNIDMNRILLVKLSSVTQSQQLFFFMNFLSELQRIKSWENIQLDSIG